ncbi:group 1 truncated hemoglobin [Microbispora sp. RL4-1S]|uniref:Group 1 truncated hemoglobin n=1 Tax=Microbispora oryzae TaxID=2806554 RepID=A0A940WFV1_9ACTN|nr:group 1 truncated hemoglobin [Microbispora oryzae]MBP2703307.1 group 1 truncated hemoglobin [Microbispora oryzae]
MTTSPSYYDQIGGAPVVRDVVDRFYTLVLADGDLAPYFTDVNIPQLKRHMVMLLCSVLGGSETYEGRDLGAAHAGLGITAQHYAKVGDILLTLLRDGGVGDEILQHVALTLSTVQSSIVAEPVEAAD